MTSFCPVLHFENWHVVLNARYLSSQRSALTGSFQLRFPFVTCDHGWSFLQTLLTAKKMPSTYLARLQSSGSRLPCSLLVSCQRPGSRIIIKGAHWNLSRLHALFIWTAYQCREHGRSTSNSIISTYAIPSENRLCFGLRQWRRAMAGVSVCRSFAQFLHLSRFGLPCLHGEISGFWNAGHK